MKLIVQSVLSAKVEFEGKTNSIQNWLLVYVWISKEDLNWNIEEKINKATKKLLNLKMMHNKETTKIDTSVLENAWEILIISNFTLYWKNKKWNSIDYMHSVSFKEAEIIYNKLIDNLLKHISVKTWGFWSYMEVTSTLDWPLNYIFEY